MKTCVTTCLPILLVSLSGAAMVTAALADDPSWVRRSSETGDMPIPNEGDQQTCCITADLDGDGIEDFVVGERTRVPAIVWYRSKGTGWEQVRDRQTDR